MNGREDYEIDPPVGDEFDGLLAAMQTYHDPEQLKEFATRIPEIIFAVRRAREERDTARGALRAIEQRITGESEIWRGEMLRAAAQDLVNVLTTLRYPDESSLWRIGGTPLEQGYQTLKAALDPISAGAERLLKQAWRAEAVATAATIALYELEHDRTVHQHTRDLLAAALAAYEAGKQAQ